MYKRQAEKPLEKCVTDMTEIKASDGKLYISAIFDCYDPAVLGLAMDTNMKASLCEQTLDNAVKAYPMLCGAILHSDRGTQYQYRYCPGCYAFDWIQLRRQKLQKNTPGMQPFL